MNNNELMHWGVLGMKWGVRRYQNPDGTLTDAGKKRYNEDGSEKSIKTRYLEGKINRLKTKRKETYNSWTKDDDLIKNGFKNKKGKVIMTPEEAKKYRKNIDDVYKKSISRNQKRLSKSKLKDYNKALKKGKDKTSEIMINIEKSNRKKARIEQGKKFIKEYKKRYGDSLEMVFNKDGELVGYQNIDPKKRRWDDNYKIINGGD